MANSKKETTAESSADVYKPTKSNGVETAVIKTDEKTIAAEKSPRQTSSMPILALLAVVLLAGLIFKAGMEYQKRQTKSMAVETRMLRRDGGMGPRFHTFRTREQ